MCFVVLWNLLTYFMPYAITVIIILYNLYDPSKDGKA